MFDKSTGAIRERKSGQKKFELQYPH